MMINCLFRDGALWKGGNIIINDQIETNYTDLTINYSLPKCPEIVMKYENSEDHLKYLHYHKG